VDSPDRPRRPMGEPMIRKLATVLGLAALLALGATGPIIAAGGQDPEATALQGAKLTLSQGIAIAEKRTGGKAFDAGVDVKAGKPHIIVETNGAHGVQTVTIDAQNGTVISVKAGSQPD
jgi:hypothetical protein